MNTKTEQRCRLCLKEPKNGFQSIDDTMKLLFGILLLKLDLDMSRDPIICQDCAEMAKKHLNFKSMCINREEMMLSFSVGRRKSKQNIKFIYVEKERVVMSDDENLDICRLCMSRLERNNFVPVPLSTLLNETVFEVITKYMPEMDFKIPEDPIVCTACRENLEGYSRFVLNWLDTQTKIKAYCRKDKSVLRFSFKDIVECPADYQILKIKQESNRTEETEDIYYPEKYAGITDQEEFDGKDEKPNFNENSGKSPSEIILVQGNITENGLNRGDGLEVKGCERSVMRINDHIVNRAERKQRGYGESNLIATDGAPDLDMYNNAEAASGSKLERHMLVHEDVTDIKMYKCALCAYEAKRKMYLERHMLVHKDISEIKVFRCSFCAFESIHRSSRIKHMLVHKDISEIKMFKCSLCAFQSKHKPVLKRHMLVHKDVSELKMFKCSLCALESKHKETLERHMLTHKDVSEIKMYKCALCPYESKRKATLTRHMLVHKEVSNMELFKCALCAYEAKRKSHLERHMLVHKDASEIEMYKCSFCSYECKQRGGLTRHMIVHKDISEIKMFKCLFCAYEAKRKHQLKTHTLVHKDASEIEMYKCSFCAYECKQRGGLTRHMIVHKDISEIKMFKCSLCAYGAKRKHLLKTHNMLVHKDVSEINTLKCSPT